MIWPPDTCSPNLEEPAESVRRLINNYKDRRAVLVPLIEKNYRDTPTAPVPVKTLCLLVKRYWGGAPYVGRPFVYTWHVGDDGQGNFVATAAEIQYLEPNPYP